jgi:hypothetical protein
VVDVREAQWNAELRTRHEVQEELGRGTSECGALNVGGIVARSVAH